MVTYGILCMYHTIHIAHTCDYSIFMTNDSLIHTIYCYCYTIHTVCMLSPVEVLCVMATYKG